jgi:predicted PurR-regulated permease PerM
LIPYLGPLLGGIPALIIGTMTAWLPGFIGVSIVYYVIQWTENNILIPTLMNKSLWVSPLVIFLCMVLGANILGIIGIFLAVPLAIIVTIVLDKHFR